MKKYWLHRVSYEGGFGILTSERKLTIGFSDIAADEKACEALSRGDWDAFCCRYTNIYNGKIPRNKAVLWRFVVEMQVGDIVLVPIPWGFDVYTIESEAILRPDLDGRDLGWYRQVQPVILGCSPRQSYASSALVSAMRCQKTNIDITRLSSEVDMAVAKKKAEGNAALEAMKNVQYRTATPYEIAHDMMNGVLTIPPVQRGYVWKAAQIEVLWDSIMRKIPIGTFSIMPSQSGRNLLCWDLIDGQQRATSIELAYHQFPPNTEDYWKDGNLTEEQRRVRALTSPVLWIDLGKECQEQFPRKYFFRVTTAAQPWGYKISVNEKSNETIDIKTRRAMVEGGIKWKNKYSVKPLENARPYPSELWPNGAEAPVPFALIDAFVREQTHVDDSSALLVPNFSSFIDYCYNLKNRFEEKTQDSFSPWNWLTRFFPEKNQVVTPSRWESFIKDLMDVEDYVVFQQNAHKVDAKRDLGIYFKRIGRNGSEPSPEEIAYSMLKVRLPELKDVMDEIARKGITSAAHMADLAIRLWLSNKKSKAVWSVSHNELMEICENEDSRKEFKDFVCGDSSSGCDSFRWYLAQVDQMLDIGANGRLLEWHRSAFCRKDADRIFQFLLMKARSPEKGVDYAGLASFLLFHAEHLDRVLACMADCHDVKTGLKAAFRTSFYSKADLVRPVFPSQLDDFIAATRSKDWCADLQRLFDTCQFPEVIKLITYGYRNRYQYAILLQATRSFIRNVFPGYDSAHELWSEENCPWDYDHILPHSSVESNKPIGKMNDENARKLVVALIDSLGNLCPLPFSINRSKSDVPPSQSYPIGLDDVDKEWVDGYQRDLLLRGDDDEVFGGLDYVDFFNNPTGEKARRFCHFTLMRLKNIYSSWFYGLGIDKLLDFSSVSAPRRFLIEKVLKELGGLPWLATTGQGISLNYPDPLMEQFMWTVSDVITLSREISFCGAEAIISYSDNDRDFFELGIKKGDNQVRKHACGISISEDFDGFVIADEQSPWFVFKRYPARPTSSDLESDIKKLMEIAENNI